MSRFHARFVTNDLGSLLATQQGGQILTQSAGADINRMARASQARSTGQLYAELLVWGDGSVTNAVSIGIATASASLSTYVGGDAESYGYRGGEGAIHHNGAATETGLTALAAGDIVGVTLELDADPQLLKFYLNGSYLTEVDLGTSPGSGKTWHLAASLAGTNDEDLLCFLNSGQRAFEYETERDAGWFSDSAALQQLFLASDDYMSASNDSPPNQAFLPVLDPSGIRIERAVSFWCLGETDAVASVIEIPAINVDGALDDLVTEDARDTEVWLERVDEGQPLSSAVRVATGVLDVARSRQAGRLVIVMRDPLATLEKPLQRAYYLPNAEAKANEPRPLHIGAVRNFEPVLVDQSAIEYEINDQPVTSVADVRDQGDLLDPDAATPEYTLSTDRRRVQLLNAPAGKLTASVSSLGEAATEGQTDLLGGIGDPFTDTTPDDELPDGFDIVGSNTGTDDPAMDPTFDWVNFPSEYFNKSYIADSSLTLEAGKTYKVEVYFNDIVPAPNQVRPRFILALYDGTDNAPSGNYWLVDEYLVEDQEMSATFTVDDAWPGTHLVPYFMVYTNNVTGGQNTMVYVRLFELPDAFAATELAGTGLEESMREVLELRAGKLPSFWSAADAQAIDTAAAYEIGYRAEGVVTQLQALLAIVEAWTASLYTDPDGTLRIVRLEDPVDTADIDLDWDVSDVELLDSVELEPALAEGLTTAIACRRNWAPYAAADFGDNDFATVNQATRRALMRDYQETVTTGQDLPGMYAHAALAEALPALVDQPTHAQAELDRVTGIFSVPRTLYVIRLPEPAGTWYQIGQVGRITHGLPGLEGGKKVLVIGEDHDVFNERVELVVLG